MTLASLGPSFGKHRRDACATKAKPTTCGSVTKSLHLFAERLMDRSVIESYAAGPAKVRAAVAGLTREELTARPGPGAWSILEVVVHLTDSDAISIDRMKRMLTEDNPSLLYADET